MHGFDALLLAIQRGLVQCRRVRAACRAFRNNADFLRCQHLQEVRTSTFWSKAPEQQLLESISSGAVRSSDQLTFLGASRTAVERGLDRAVEAMDERGLLAEAGRGDVAILQLQSLFNRAVGAVNMFVEMGPDSLFQTYRANLRIARYLLTRYPAINPAATDYRNAAVTACGYVGDATLMQQLLADARIDPAAHPEEAGGVALRFACGAGHTEVVRMLLADARSDPTIADNVAIRMASHNGHTEVVRLLLADARVNPAVWFNFANVCQQQQQWTRGSGAAAVGR